MSSFNWPSTSGGVTIYANSGALPANGTPQGNLAVAADTGNLWEWNGASWVLLATPSASPNAIDQLTGDVTATGPGIVASTVAKIQGTIVSGTTGSVNVVFSTSPTLVTPTLGVFSASSASAITGSASAAYVALNITNTNATNPYTQLNLNNGTGTVKTGVVAYAPGIAFTVGPTANDTTTPLNLVTNNSTTGLSLSATGVINIPGLTASTALALDSSKNIISVTNTGTGNNVLATSPSLTTPSLGVASATSINKLTITAPATGSTFTLLDGKTFTVNNTLTLTATDGSTLAIGAGGTLGSNAYTSTAYAPLASPTFTGTVTIPTPFTIGAVSMTATGTQLNYLASATGTTGTTSTNLVFSAAPALTGAGTITDAFTIINATTSTKVLAFSLTGMTAAKTLTLSSSQTTTQTLTIPNITAGDTLATLGLAQTFSAVQTFTLAPIFSSVTASQILSVNGSKALTSIAYATAPAASTISEWDANKNLSANALIPSFTTQATAASTLTMTIASTQLQYFTGSTASQVVKLPTTSVVAGMPYTIVNNSTQTIAIQSSGANAILTMAANTQATFTAIVATPTTAANWDYIYSLNTNSNLIPNLTGDVTSSGTATTAAATQANITTLSYSSGVAVHGSNTNDSAAAGYVGEIITANSAGVSPSTFGSGSYGTIASLLSLPAGDWDVEGVVNLSTGAALASCTQWGVQISTTNNGLDSASSGGLNWFTGTITASGTYYIPTGVRRMSLSTATNIYLTGQLTYGTLGSTTWGTNSFIRARRVR